MITAVWFSCFIPDLGPLEGQDNSQTGPGVADWDGHVSLLGAADM